MKNYNCVWCIILKKPTENIYKNKKYKIFVVGFLVNLAK